MSGYGKYLEDPTASMSRATYYRRRKRRREIGLSSSSNEDHLINNSRGHPNRSSTIQNDCNNQAASHSFPRTINDTQRPPQDSRDTISVSAVDQTSNESFLHLNNVSSIQEYGSSSTSSRGTMFGLIDDGDYSFEDSWIRDMQEDLLSDHFSTDSGSDDESISSTESVRDSLNDSYNAAPQFRRLEKFINDAENNDTINIVVAVSKSELILSVLKFALKYNLCQSAIADLYKMLNCILGSNVLPQSRYLVDKLFNTDTNIDYHANCPKCKQYVKKFNREDREVLCSCNHNILLKDPTYFDFFAIMNIEKQIATLLRDNDEYFEAIVLRRKEQNNYFNDFTDGIMYKNFVTLLPDDEKDHFVTLTFNTDGSPVFESSKFSVWPIQVVVNEVPFEVRTKNPIICGIWFGKSKPDMNIFLKPFVDQINQLANRGVHYKINGVRKTVKVYAICACVDSAARPPMQGMVQYNGYYGCGWCKHPGEYVRTRTGGSVKYVLLDYIPEKRIETETLEFMRESLTSRNAVCGIKNPSCLINLQGFNIISGFVPDAMHNVCLGIVEQIMNYWIDSNGEAYSLSKHDVAKVNQILENITVPSRLARLSRSLSDRNWWKAREFENWLQYYCIPIMLQFPHMQRFVHHIALLSHAFFLLNKDNISHIDVHVADYMLQKFVAQTELYYGKVAMTYNIHLLLHLPQSVLDFGPLWSHNGYCFETGNGQLVRKIQAAKGVVHQLCRMINMKHAETILEEHVATRPHSSMQVYIVYLDKKKVKVTFKITKARYFGPYKQTPCEWIEFLQLSNQSRSYRKIVKNKCVLTSFRNRSLRSNNSYVLTKSGKYVRLQEFIVDEITHKEFVLCSEIVTENIMGTAIHIKKVKEIVDEVIAVETNDIDRICVYMKIDNNSYISCTPNMHCY